ncbi:5086_t:CDS:2 [Acaulospora colombiana]|uniref:5086_t:CDS:1 n=1 Tax=Acaulospora colombiana TaxID=27376 RepID=A0ACA9JZ73_9GLOM|nr:5086_t:CDS:2 [Acaulospora colombiana]
MKDRLGNRIIQKRTDKETSEFENKNYGNRSQPPKRKYDDSDVREMMNFVRDILKEVSAIEERSKQKVMKLALREDKDLMQIWRTEKTVGPLALRRSSFYKLGLYVIVIKFLDHR